MTQDPKIRLFINTPYETIPFNFKYKDGKESFSFLVPRICHTVVEFLLRRPMRDTKADLTQWAVDHVGRRWDRDRCCGFAMRTTAEGRIEVRLQFLAPWYLESYGRTSDGEGAGPDLDGPR